MALRGKKPETIEKRLKVLFYGRPKVGKTTAAIQFPAPYMIDTEKGAENDQYVKILSDNNGAYFNTTDPDDLISEIKALLSEKHDYKTLIIDPLTIIYNNLLEKGMDDLGFDFGKYKFPANRKIKHILTLLLRLDMNVIVTSHAKSKWVKAKDNKGRDTVIEEGYTFDCYDKLDYLFDLVLEIQKRGDSRIGIVKETRLISFPEGEQFPFSYNAIADKYGRHILEKEVKPEILATPQQIKEIKRLIEFSKITEDVWQKWLDNSDSVTFEEMSSENIQKCIDFVNKKFIGETA